MAAITLLPNGSRSTTLKANESYRFVTLIDGRPIVPDVWWVYVGGTQVFTGVYTDITFVPTTVAPHTIHVIVQHPDGYAVEGLFVFPVTTRPAGVASLYVQWDKSVYQERDDLIANITWLDPEGLPATIGNWTLRWNNQVMMTGTGQTVHYRSLYHGLWRLEVTGTDFYGVPISGDATAFVQPYYERRDCTIPTAPDGTLVYLGSVYSGVIDGEGGTANTLPYQTASYAQGSKLLPGTTHILFGLDPDYCQVDDEVVIRTHTGNYALMGSLLPNESVGYDYLPNDYLPAPVDQQLGYTIDVFNASGVAYSAMHFRVRVQCFRLVPQLYRYSQCPYSTMPGGEGERQRRWAVLFTSAQVDDVAYTTPPPGTIPLTTLTASGLPMPVNSLTRAGYSESNRYAVYEHSDAPDLDAKAVCAIEGLRPFCMAIQQPANQPVFRTLKRLSGKMYLYFNGSALSAGATVRVRIQGGYQETVYTVPVTVSAYNPAEDAFVLVGAVDADISDYQFDFNGIVAWIEMDETTAVTAPPGTLPTPAWGPTYVYSGTYSGTVARGVRYDGACYSSPVKATAVDVEAATIVQQTNGCVDPVCGPLGVYCYISVCPPGTCVSVIQPLHNPAPYVAYGTRPFRCYELPEFVSEGTGNGTIGGDFIPVEGNMCGDGYKYLRCDLKQTAVVVYPCATTPHGYVLYGDNCFALSGVATSYGSINMPVGSVTPVSGCADVLCTGSNANGNAFIYWDTQTNDRVPVYFEGLANGVPTFGVSPAKIDLGSNLTDGLAPIKFVSKPRVQFMQVPDDGALTIDVGLPSLNKRIIVQHGFAEASYELPMHVTSINLPVQAGDRLSLDISAYGSFTKRLKGLSTIVKWTPYVIIPRLFDTAYGSVAGTYSIRALGFTGPTDRTNYQLYDTLPADTMVTVVNPDSLVTVQGVTNPTPEYLLVRCRSVGEVPPTAPAGLPWYAGQTFSGQVKFNFYGLRNKQASHGEMDVWFSTEGDFPTYLLAQPWRALVHDQRSYRCEGSMAKATRNAFAASEGLAGAQLPNVYAAPTTGQVISSKSSSFALRKAGVPYYRKRVDTGIARQVVASDDVEIMWAHISDWGFTGPNTNVQAIANMIHGWNPDFIITSGDNWQDGSSATFASLDNKTGYYYHDFIFPYTGIYGVQASEQRLFVAPGNHDHDPYPRIIVHNAYFNVPGQNYEFVKWPVHFFMLDNTNYIVGGDATSTGPTARWLQARLAASTAPWKVVSAHYNPYCSSTDHSIYASRRWPYGEWGANILMQGHSHVYERFMLPSGLVAINHGQTNPEYYGVANPALMWRPLPEAYSTYGYWVAPQVRAACRFRATATRLVMELVSTAGPVLDTVTLTK